MNSSGTVNVKHDMSREQINKEAITSSSEEKPKNADTKSEVDILWEQMNKGVSKEMLHRLTNKCNSTVKKATKKTPSNWMTYLGLAPKVTGDVTHNAAQKRSTIVDDTASEEAKKLASAALAAVKDAAAAAAAASSKGKFVVTEVRDFAGQEIEIKKHVDGDSKEGAEKTKVTASSAVDAVLEQIKKKPKLSVLDKTKKDWGEYKGENKGLEDELDAYKKSSNQYLDKVSFLQRADYREFERERDARLAMQARRRPEMREEP